MSRGSRICYRVEVGFFGNVLWFGKVGLEDVSEGERFGVMCRWEENR